MIKSAVSPRIYLQQFLMQYRRTPLACGYSPSELLNYRQIRSQIDILVPSPTQEAQRHHCTQTVKANQSFVQTKIPKYQTGMLCYALYYGPRRNKDHRWVPAVATKVFGPRSAQVRVHPKGPIWHRHIEQLRPRYHSTEDEEPGDAPYILGLPSIGEKHNYVVGSEESLLEYQENSQNQQPLEELSKGPKGRIPPQEWSRDLTNYEDLHV